MKPLMIALALGFLGTAAASAQGNTVVGLQLGPGYTVIDLPSALDYDDDELDDWNQFFGAIKLQGTFARLGNVRVGAEIGYSRLYYYYAIVQYVPNDLIYEEDVWVWSVAGLAALDVSPQIELQGAAGLYGFDDGITFGLKGAALYRLQVAEKVAIPVGASVDVIFGDGTPIGLALAVGVEYTVN
jgi:hypothetical protein